MTDGTDATGTPEPQPSGLFDTWLNLYFAPRQAFEAIVSRPRILVPLLLSLALVLVFILTWVHHLDPVEFAKTQLQDQGVWDKIPPEARQAQVQGRAWFTTHLLWIFAPVITLLSFLIEAGYFLVAARFFYGTATRFKQIFSLTIWANLAIQVISIPLVLITLFLKGDWNVDPGEAFQVSVAALMDKGETARWLWALGGSLDLFSFWLIAMLSIGLGVAMRKKATAAAWPVIIAWAIIVAIKVGFTAMMS